MKLGIQIGKLFIGFETKGGMTAHAPFTENIEAGTPYRVTANNWSDLKDVLRGTYSDKNLVKLFESISEIFSPVDGIVSRAASGKFVFKKKSNDEIIYDNPILNRFLEQPNPFQNFNQLFYDLGVWEYINGKAFLYANTPRTLAQGNYENISTLWALPSTDITINLPERLKLFSATKVSDVITNYILEEGTENEQIFKVEQVLYRQDHSLNWKRKKVKGRSRLLSAEKAISNLIVVYEARGHIYIKRGSMGMWVSEATDNSGKIALTDSEKKAARKEIDEAYGVVGKTKDTVGLSSAPMRFEKTSMSIAEMLPFEETKADAAAINAVLKFPDELAPGNDNGTFENKRTAEQTVYRNASIPLAYSWCQSINNFIFAPEDDIYLDVTFEHIEVLQADKEKKSLYDAKNGATWLQQFTNGIITLNDWRVHAGMEKVTKIKLYDKLIYEMEAGELKQVQEILNIQKPTSNNVEKTSKDNPK